MADCLKFNNTSLIHFGSVWRQLDFNCCLIAYNSEAYLLLENPTASTTLTTQSNGVHENVATVLLIKREDDCVDRKVIQSVPKISFDLTAVKYLVSLTCCIISNFG